MRPFSKLFDHLFINPQAHSRMLLLARLMEQYCFARWCSSASVVCRRLLRCRRAGGPAAERVGGQAAALVYLLAARRASTVTSR